VDLCPHEVQGLCNLCLWGISVQVFPPKLLKKHQDVLLDILRLTLEEKEWNSSTIEHEALSVRGVFSI
jgi:hypothetical protein